MTRLSAYKQAGQLKGFQIDVQVLVNAGFGVLFTNPRGSTGYGDNFSFAVHGDWEHGHTLYDELLRVPLILRQTGRGFDIGAGFGNADFVGECGCQ